VFSASIVLLAACSEPNVPGVATPEPAPVVQKPLHNYLKRDGMDYLYQSALSENARQAGQAAASVVALMYAGTRDGRHQLHMRDGLRFTAFECANPCDVIKVMSFVDADYVREHVYVERLAFDPKSVIGAGFEDAIAGRLANYGVTYSGKTFQRWMTEGGVKDIRVEPPRAKP
jgi:hypothetical protein